MLHVGSNNCLLSQSQDYRGKQMIRAKGRPSLPRLAFSVYAALACSRAPGLQSLHPLLMKLNY